MIRNIIFDMGGVLIDYTPKEYMESIGIDGDIAEFMFENVFNSKTWQELDRGTYTFKEGIEIFIEKNPELENEIKKVFEYNVEKMMAVKEDTSDFLKQLKSEGYNIYILSNFSEEAYNYILPKYDYLNYVDEKIISGQVNMIKPEREIYKYMIEKLNIIPSESIFIDDVQENIDAAKEAGLRTVLFTDLIAAKEEVRGIINEQ